MKVKKISLYTATLLFTSSALAHGYVESPPSRAYQCHLGKNTDCGSVQWEPQSVEQASGFPEGAMPPDGKLASAGKSNFSQLDSQSPTRWAKTTIKSGKNNFVWHHSAPHRTTNWRYYITKQNWDQNKPLTRSDFETKPFCQIDGNGATPAVQVTHSCNVPDRTGYQVIYAVREIADTANSFIRPLTLISAAPAMKRRMNPSGQRSSPASLAGKICMREIKSLPISLTRAVKFIRYKRN